MRIFTKLYTMAKLMQMILLSYGIEVFYETVLLPSAPPSLSPSPNN